jgi:prephenate dehydrogenase (NADP+)
MYAVVAGQTSVKAPEKAAFEKFLPEDVHIISCHSLHGPTVNPVGQPLVSIRYTASSSLHWTYITNFLLFPICGSKPVLSQVLIQHRGSNDALALVENILRPLGSRHVHLSYEEHDLVTANTQAVTHAAFLR